MAFLIPGGQNTGSDSGTHTLSEVLWSGRAETIGAGISFRKILWDCGGGGGYGLF